MKDTDDQLAQAMGLISLGNVKENGDTVLIIEPPDYRVKKLVPSVLRILGWPQGKKCWRCKKNDAEFGAEILETIFEVKHLPAGGGYHARSISGYICVPRCESCLKKESKIDGFPDAIGGCSLLALMPLAVFGLLRGCTATRDTHDLLPEFMFSLIKKTKEINSAPFTHAATILGFLFALSLTWAAIRSRYIRRKLIKDGLNLSPHPNIEKARADIRKAL